MIQEQPHSLLVRRAHHAARRTARARRVHCQREARGVDKVGRLEAEVGKIIKVQPVVHRVRARRVAERELNGQAHVLRAELRHHRAVDKLYHRVYDALRVNNHLYIVRADGKEVHRLYKLQALVHHRRAVNGYFRAHAPVGVLDRLLRRDVFQLRARPAAKRSAAAGEQQLFQLALSAPHEALEDGGMLGIDGDYLRAPLRCAAHDYLPRADKRLLICQRDALFRVYRGERRAQPYRAGHGGDNAVCLIERRRLDEPLYAGADADVRIRHGKLELLCGALIVYGDEFRL